MGHNCHITQNKMRKIWENKHRAVKRNIFSKGEVNVSTEFLIARA